MSNNPENSNIIDHSGKTKEARIWVRGQLSPEIVDKVNKGIKLSDLEKEDVAEVLMQAEDRWGGWALREIWTEYGL